MSLTRADAPTLEPSQLQEDVLSQLFGFDGTVWRRVSVTAGGSLVVSSGGTAPGTTIDSPADTAVGVGATVALTTPPAGTTRMTVQVTGGDDTTLIRVREAGGTAGAGLILNLYGSRVYGADGGSIADLEVQNVTGPIAAVAIQFEGA